MGFTIMNRFNTATIVIIILLLAIAVNLTLRSLGYEDHAVYIEELRKNNVEYICIYENKTAWLQTKDTQM
jgi:uncharacterized membrane protein